MYEIVSQYEQACNTYSYGLQHNHTRRGQHCTSAEGMHLIAAKLV